MKIKDMPFFTQPYHRLKKNGVSSLSDAELLAIIISSGSRGESAVDTANRILKKYNFNKLSGLNLTELKKELGNEVKALRILSLLEINKDILDYIIYLQYFLSFFWLLLNELQLIYLENMQG